MVNVLEEMSEAKLRWFGHVQRKNKEDVHKRRLRMEQLGRKLGRVRPAVSESIEKEAKMLELIKSLVIESAKSTDEMKYSCTKRFSIIHYYSNNNYRRK